MGYKATPVVYTVEKMLQPFRNAYRAAAGEDVKKTSVTGGVFDAAVIYFKLPGRQMKITLGYLADLVSGEEESIQPLRLLYPERKR
jgi:hypothetical protein